MANGDEYVAVLHLKSAYDNVDRHKLPGLCHEHLAIYETNMAHLVIGLLKVGTIGDAT